MSQPERFEILIFGSGQGGELLAWHMARSGQAISCLGGDSSFRSCYSIDIPLAGSEAGLLLGAFRIKGAGRWFGTARCGCVLILPPMLAVNITKSN